MRKKTVYTLLGIILVFSFTARYKGLMRQQPHDLTVDEGLYTMLGEQLRDNPFNYTTKPMHDFYMARGNHPPDYLKRPLFKHPPLFSYLISSVFLFTQPSYKAAGIVSVVTGTLLILVVFFLTRLLYDERVGLLATLFLMFDPIHWLCSEKIWMETTMSMFIWLTFLLFVIAVRRTPKLYIAAGIACGLAALTKYPGLIVIPIILTYGIICQPKLYKKALFWLMLITPLIMMIPWIAWNIKIYGASAFDIRQMHDGSVGILDLLGKHTKGAWLTIPIIATILLPAIIYIRVNEKNGRVINALRLDQIIPHPRALLLILGFAISAGIFLHPYVLHRLMQSFSLAHVPRTGWIIGMFEKEPKIFYLIQLMEHSPVYIISFLSIAFLLRSGDKSDLLLLFSAVWILAFYILWGNYQCRYILSAVPALLIIAARTIVWAWEKLRKNNSPLLSTAIPAFLLFLLGLSLIKTLKVGLALAVTDLPCYF